MFQSELDVTARVWNSHVIRQSKRGLPSGRPTVMFEVPSLYGTSSYLNTISEQELNACVQLCSFRSAIPCDTDMYTLCCQTLRQHQLAYPDTPDQAMHAYCTLRQSIRNLLNL